MLGNMVMPVRRIVMITNNPQRKEQHNPAPKKESKSEAPTFQEVLEMEMLKQESKHLRQYEIDALFNKYVWKGGNK